MGMPPGASRELVLEKHLDMLSRTALAHVGAGRGLFLVPHGQELRLTA